MPIMPTMVTYSKIIPKARAMGTATESKHLRRLLRGKSSLNLISMPCLFLFFMFFISSIVDYSSAFQSTNIVSKCHESNRIGFSNLSFDTEQIRTVLFAFPKSNNNNDDDDDGDEDKKKDDWNPSNLLNAFKNFFGNSNDSDRNLRMDGKSSSNNKNNKNSAPIFPQFFQPPGLSSDDDYYDGLGEFYDTGRDFDDNNDVEDEEEEDDLPAGTSLLLRIRAKQLKPGGLRLFLMFYLMGMQNTPDKNTWRADQRLMTVNVNPSGYKSDEFLQEDTPEEKKYVLEMLYETDRTGMLQIELIPDDPNKPNKKAEIRIYRCGSRPSTSYLMQESVIVDGILDELQNISGEKNLATTIPKSDNPEIGQEPEIAEEDRLLITDPPNAIEAARETLAFS